VAQLPVQDNHGNRIPPTAELRTSGDYKAYIRSRTAAWKKSRKTAEFHTQSAKKREAKKHTHATRKRKKKS
jgi:hypothetical protein